MGPEAGGLPVTFTTTTRSEIGGTTGGVCPPLVSSDWALEHLDDSSVRFIEVDDRPARGLYGQAHLPGAVEWNWSRDLQDGRRRDVVGRPAMERLLGAAGLSHGMHIVLYGDDFNWFAAYAYWLLRMYGWPRLSLLDGGRRYWLDHRLPVDREPASHPLTIVKLDEANLAARVFRDEVIRLVDNPTSRVALVDVRSPTEFSGDVIAPPGMNETAQRGGHIPGAVSIPWETAVGADGRLLPVDELVVRYASEGVTPDRDVVTYCRIGERSSHTWFVLNEILGFPRVRNYDGSWTEWGSMIGLPIER
jgi:thiosulfate/3-mercaptopyruvate sulfurtransferase